MAKTVAPLLSFSAGGAIAKTQVYATWKGRAYARRYVVPANPRSLEQTKTRSLFRWLTEIWKYYPAASIDAWGLYADSLRITDRNAFMHVNIGPMRGDANLLNFLASPAARSGIAISTATVTPGSGQLTVAMTPPPLPTGWTTIAAHALAIPDQDPQTETDYTVKYATDAVSAYAPVIAGLAASLHIVAAWFTQQRADGLTAYGQAYMTTGTPS